jgi:hypothetical protein
MQRYPRLAGSSRRSSTVGAGRRRMLVVLRGTSNGNGPSTGRHCREGKAGEVGEVESGRRLLPAAAKLPRTKTHDEGSFTGFPLLMAHDEGSFAGFPC